MSDVDTLRRSWEFVSTCQLLWILQNSLRLKVYTLLELEVAIFQPEESLVLGDIFTKLLLPTKADRCELLLLSPK